MKANSILVTGGAGYIGSHTVTCLLEAGHEVVVLDNLSNAERSVLPRIETLTGRPVQAFIEADVQDYSAVKSALRDYDCGAVMHFAGLKAVGESVQNPLLYYRENVAGTLCLLEAMVACDVNTLVFSSSATVYGDPQFLPYTEDHPLAPTNPYGQTKRHIEDMLRDLCQSQDDMRVALLRYFNPCGAHASGMIGENPRGIPNNLVPFIAQVASGQRDALNIYGNDYDTPDGTGVRDYVHVIDLAMGHIAALDFLASHMGCHVFNLGTGKGASVLEVLKAFEAAVGRPLPYRIAPRRPGDLAAYHADSTKAQQRLGWEATRDLKTMCEDHWRWQQSLL